VIQETGIAQYHFEALLSMFLEVVEGFFEDFGGHRGSYDSAGVTFAECHIRFAD